MSEKKPFTKPFADGRLSTCGKIYHKRADSIRSGLARRNIMSFSGSSSSYKDAGKISHLRVEQIRTGLKVFENKKRGAFLSAVIGRGGK